MRALLGLAVCVLGLHAGSALNNSHAVLEWLDVHHQLVQAREELAQLRLDAERRCAVVPTKSLFSPSHPHAKQLSYECPAGSPMAHVCINSHVAGILLVGSMHVLTADDMIPTVVAVILESALVQSQLPTEVGLLTDCNFLYSVASLTGTIPSEIGNMRQLQYWYTSDDSLSGTIPSQLGLLTDLASFKLGSNQVQGTLPTELSNLSNLLTLTLSSLDITGPLFSLASLVQLTSLTVKFNSVSGAIPFDELLAKPNLERLALGGTQMTGTLPTELGTLSMLTRIELELMDISGTIPSQVGVLTALKVLMLNDNALTSTLPSQIGLLSALELLGVSRNELTGTIPEQLGELSLATVNIARNAFHGKAPGRLLDAASMDCQFSGLSEPLCKEVCRQCGLSAFEFRGCDANGKHQLCVSVYWLAPCLVLCVVPIEWTNRKLMGRAASRRRRVTVLVTLLGLVDFFSNVGFAASATVGQIGTLSLSFSVAFVLINFTVSMGLASAALAGTRTARFRVHNTDRLQRHQMPFAFSSFFSFFVPWVLPLVLLPVSETNGARLWLVGLGVALLLQDIPQLIFQSVQLAEGEQNLMVVLALVTTVVCLVCNVSALVWRALEDRRRRLGARDKHVTVELPVA